LSHTHAARNNVLCHRLKFITRLVALCEFFKLCDVCNMIYVNVNIYTNRHSPVIMCAICTLLLALCCNVVTR